MPVFLLGDKVRWKLLFELVWATWLALSVATWHFYIQTVFSSSQEKEDEQASLDVELTDSMMSKQTPLQNLPRLSPEKPVREEAASLDGGDVPADKVT